MASSGSSVANVSPGTNHSWVGLTDVVRNVLAQEVRLKVQPLLRFAQFAKRKTELGTQPGNTIQMLTFGNLPLGGQLSEGIEMSTNAMTTQIETVTVYEQGNAVAMTEYLLRSTFTDFIGNASMLLAIDAAKVLDLTIRRALELPKSIVYGGTRTSRSTVTTGDVLKLSHFQDAAATLAINKVPKYVGRGRDAYVAMVHPQVVRTLKKDTHWESANEYAGSTNIFRGEVGRYDDVIFVETTMCPILKGLNKVFVDGVDVTTKETDTTRASGAVDLYKSYLLGGDSVALATGLPIEIRENVSRDFGRDRSIAWYSIFGSMALDFYNHPSDHSAQEIKFVRLESAGV